MIIISDVLQVLDEYSISFGESWRNSQADGTQPWPYLDQALTKFQVSMYLIVSASARA